MAGDLLEGGEPDAFEALHEMDQPVEETDARRATDDEGVHGENVTTADVVVAGELLGPGFVDGLGTGDAVAESRDRAETEVGPVVIEPLNRNLEQLFLAGVDEVGLVVAHQAGVVEEAVLLEQGRTGRLQLPGRGAIAAWSHAGDRLQDLQPADHDPLFLVLIDE